MTTEIVTADVLEWARTYDGPKFHALLCDPPYELGFMGKHWDAQGVAFDPATWAALAEHLHPGAFIMAFASSRGWHRLACAIEDAGLRIHPSVFLWANGAGFPKATRVKDAPDFDGHRYGGQALKPAVEPIIVAQVPYVGKPRDCIVATGAGALWVDGGRVPTGENVGRDNPNGPYRSDRTWNTSNTPGRNGAADPPAGRWLPNFALVHSPECNGVCIPECPVRRLGEQSGERCGANGAKHDAGRKHGFCDGRKSERDDDWGAPRDGLSTAARFFPNHDYALDIAERIAAADPVLYQSKASRRERNAGCENWPAEHVRRHSGGEFAHNSGSENSSKNGAHSRNPHPTVKPLALARWLATLLLPPDAYAPRRILIPFAGSGSEMIGAMLAGWEHVTAVERDPEYVAIGEARVKWWAANRDKAPKVRAMERAEPMHSRGGRDMRGGKFAAEDAIVRTNGHPTPAPMLPGLEDAP